MSNRKTNLDMSVFNVFGNTLIGDLKEISVEVENRTAEGRGVADIDDYPVLLSRGSRITATLMVPASSGTVALMGTALSLNPAGTVLVVSGAGNFSATAVITNCNFRVSRDNLTEYDITLVTRGAVTYP